MKDNNIILDFWNNNKKVIILCIVAVAVLVISAMGVIFYLNKAQDSKAEKTAQLSDTVYKQGFDAGQKVLDENLKKTTNPEEQSRIYINKATLMSQANDDDKTKALEYAYTAEKLYPTENTAMLIASLSEAQKNSINAIKYYKLYLERVSKKITSEDPNDMTVREYNYYKKHLEALEKGVK